MPFSYAFNFVASMLSQTWMVPWIPYAAALGLALLVIAAISKQAWVQWLVAAVFLAASATYSIWVLPIGLMLAGLGLVLVVAGVVWKYAGRARADVGGGLMWPGIGLLLAPLANIFVVMPLMRFS
jgi:hypothetical protein